MNLSDVHLDFKEIIGMQEEETAAYAVCYLESETDLKDVRIEHGNLWQTKLYLNGREIYPTFPSGVTESITELKAGLNVVVLKSINKPHPRDQAVWFTKRDGSPLPGLSQVMEPGE